jgi:hypothetical protein
MLQRALGAGVPAGWVTADQADGGSPALRGWLEALQLPYVLAVKATEPLPSASGSAMPAARLAGRIPPHCWLRLSAGHGPRAAGMAGLEPPAARRHWRAGGVGALAAAPQPDQRGVGVLRGRRPGWPAADRAGAGRGALAGRVGRRSERDRVARRRSGDGAAGTGSVERAVHRRTPPPGRWRSSPSTQGSKCATTMGWRCFNPEYYPQTYRPAATQS